MIHQLVELRRALDGLDLDLSKPGNANAYFRAHAALATLETRAAVAAQEAVQAACDRCGECPAPADGACCGGKS